jgi:hypothetical protein
MHLGHTRCPAPGWTSKWSWWRMQTSSEGATIGSAPPLPPSETSLPWGHLQDIQLSHLSLRHSHSDVRPGYCHGCPSVNSHKVWLTPYQPSAFRPSSLFCQHNECDMKGVRMITPVHSWDYPYLFLSSWLNSSQAIHLGTPPLAVSPKKANTPKLPAYGLLSPVMLNLWWPRSLGHSSPYNSPSCWQPDCCLCSLLLEDLAEGLIKCPLATDEKGNFISQSPIPSPAWSATAAR